MPERPDVHRPLSKVEQIFLMKQSHPNMTQTEIAQSVGVSQPFVSQVLNPPTENRLSYLNRLQVMEAQVKSMWIAKERLQHRLKEIEEALEVPLTNLNEDKTHNISANQIKHAKRQIKQELIKKHTDRTVVPKIT